MSKTRKRTIAETAQRPYRDAGQTCSVVGVIPSSHLADAHKRRPPPRLSQRSALTELLPCCDKRRRRGAHLQHRLTSHRLISQVGPDRRGRRRDSHQPRSIPSSSTSLFTTTRLTETTATSTVVLRGFRRLLGRQLCRVELSVPNAKTLDGAVKVHRDPDDLRHRRPKQEHARADGHRGVKVSRRRTRVCDDGCAHLHVGGGDAESSPGCTTSTSTSVSNITSPFSPRDPENGRINKPPGCPAVEWQHNEQYTKDFTIPSMPFSVAVEIRGHPTLKSVCVQSESWHGVYFSIVGAGRRYAFHTASLSPQASTTPTTSCMKEPAGCAQSRIPPHVDTHARHCSARE